MKKMRNRKLAEKKAISLGKALAIGLGTGLAVWAALLLGASAVIAGFDDPERYIMPAVFLLAATAAFTAGAVSGRLFGGGVLAPGLLSGGVLLLAVWALSLACAGGGDTMTSLPLKLVLCAEFLFFALIGARIAKPARKKVRGR